MDIQYQTLLNDYPTWQSTRSNYLRRLEPITLDEIVTLENTYNNSSKFPVSLREMLFLAGNNCYVLDRGLFNTQAAMQEGTRSWLSDANRVISHPFYAIDVYNGSGQFLFVYLDEDKNDPKVYEAYLPQNENFQIVEEIRQTLSEYITDRMKVLLSGENPF